VKLKLLACLPSVLAWERLQRGETQGLSRDEFMQLVREATGSDRAAREAGRRRMAAQMEAGITPR
jgi:hypothetical protein